MQEEKKQIHIQVKDKIATFVSMNFTLVGGNSDYEVVFDFDSDWSAYPVKTALFVYADDTKRVVFNGNICKGVPIENASVCLIGVFADDIATSTPAFIKDVRHSIRDVAKSLPEPPTEDVYNQIMELLNRYINEASGIPSGGSKGQVLKKASDNDYDATWQDDEKGTQISEADILRVVKEYIEQNPPQDGFSPTVDIIPVDNGYTVNITDKNDVHSYTLYNGLNGISATHSWNGTILTVSSASGTSSADLKGEKGEKGERGEQGVQGLQGVQGIQGIQGVQGEKGDKGDGFSISKTYISVAAMNAGFYTDDVPLNGFVLINTGNVNDVDNAKLFVKTLTGYSYLTDLSGSQGIKGDKGDKGDQGVQGEQGIRGEQGIQGIQGEKGADGINGKDGKTPYIQDGYWYIDGVNTNVKARGVNGRSVSISNIEQSTSPGGETIVYFDDGNDLSILNGKDGETIVVRKAEESTESGALNKITFSDGTRINIRNGLDGKDGKDYVITDADYSQIAAIVLELLGGEPIHGYIDENNNIVLKGNLAEDKYSVKYEMEDENGNISYIEIGDLVLDNTATYTVTTPTLTNCTFSGAKEAIKGQGYEATVTANDGYKLSTLTATMEGGGSITTDKATGKIGTSKVTGNITITAEAEKIVVAEPTNFFNSSEAPATAGRIGSDGNNRTDATNSFATNYIPVQNGDIVEISGCTICGIVSGTNTYFMGCYNAEKVKIFAGQPKTSGAYCTVVADANSDKGTVTITNDSVKFVRFTCSATYDTSKPVDVNNIVINIKRNGAYL